MALYVLIQVRVHGLRNRGRAPSMDDEDAAMRPCQPPDRICFVWPVAVGHGDAPRPPRLRVLWPRAQVPLQECNHIFCVA
eukprot:1452394-Pyramimonas_sp.AAC.1